MAQQRSPETTNGSSPDPEATAIIPVPSTKPVGEETMRLDLGEKTVKIQLPTTTDAAATQVIPRVENSATQLIRRPIRAGKAKPPTAPADATPGLDTRLEFAAIAILGGLLGVAGQLVPHHGARLVLLLAMILVAPGAAVLGFVPLQNRLTAWSMATALSLSISVAPAVLTLWLHVWNPAASLGVLAGAALVAGAVQVVRQWRSGARFARPALSDPGEPGGARLTTILPLVTLPAGLALWIVTLVRFSPADFGAYGLSTTLGVPFFVALALLGIGFGAELFGRARPLVLIAGILAVPAIMQATVPILSGTIEYAWTYKHLGVVELIRDNGHLIDSTDIYQQWPGFFAVVAMLSKVSGLDPISFAAWSSLACMLLNGLMTAALLRQFTTNRRVIALGTLMAQMCMWVDIGYFSPQGYVYPLMLAFWVIVIRWLTGPPTGEITRFPRGERLRAWLTRDLPEHPDVSRRGKLWAGAAATVIYAAIVVSHQLTPVMMMVPLVVLAVLGILRPRLLAVVFGAVLVAFLAPRIGSVSSQYSIFDFNLFANASGNAASWSTPQQEFSALVARALAIGLWATGLFTVWRARKRLGTVLVAALLAYLPITTLAGGSYGGEAIYRVYAFSLPFTALLVATVWAGGKPHRTWSWKIGTGVLAGLLMFAGLQGLQGQSEVHFVTRTDIVAADYLYAHARPGSGVILIAPNFPTKLRGNYGSFNKGHVSVDISLIGDPYFTGNLNSSRIADLTEYVKAMNYPTNYLVVSDSMERQTSYFGTLPAGSFASLTQGLKASADWKVFYAAPGVTIYQTTG
ncbi:hypothetical protein GCM10010168_37140 [Actinoplanes ianthinogenes]|uniref:Glycosyltransferase RgtA/B/C/D-like domain-containing protein n=1 Tax=Actinoplanes ianthinogenes TaxID=122358 RepID=A0ABM7M596_9ACTN|nr:hypothetical protein [Actinoplanes ianthinogenes]BCJ46764.1 hypothetical protein Aiant_74210 [Actinoplanes ianthinogenes]GGR15747.1 hypothetical protein GCM10010168_37140 [Actinoplanes ianthinogenes]